MSHIIFTAAALAVAVGVSGVWRGPTDEVVQAADGRLLFDFECATDSPQRNSEMYAAVRDIAFSGCDQDYGLEDCIDHYRDISCSDTGCSTSWALSDAVSSCSGTVYSRGYMTQTNWKIFYTCHPGKPGGAVNSVPNFPDPPEICPYMYYPEQTPCSPTTSCLCCNNSSSQAASCVYDKLSLGQKFAECGQRSDILTRYCPTCKFPGTSVPVVPWTVPYQSRTHKSGKRYCTETTEITLLYHVPYFVVITDAGNCLNRHYFGPMYDFMPYFVKYASDVWDDTPIVPPQFYETIKQENFKCMNDWGYVDGFDLFRPATFYHEQSECWGKKHCFRKTRLNRFSRLYPDSEKSRKPVVPGVHPNVYCPGLVTEIHECFKSIFFLVFNGVCLQKHYIGPNNDIPPSGGLASIDKYWNAQYDAVEMAQRFRAIDELWNNAKIVEKEMWIGAITDTKTCLKEKYCHQCQREGSYGGLQGLYRVIAIDFVPVPNA